MRCQGLEPEGFPGAGAETACLLLLAKWLPSWLSWRVCELPNIVSIYFLLKLAGVVAAFAVVP